MTGLVLNPADYYLLVVQVVCVCGFGRDEGRGGQSSYGLNQDLLDTALFNYH